ncbi:putative peroxidoxin 2 [Cyclospora cayetanensis]|uniref:Peroxidoxin 2 n=1 Tax=Cyclospora cayetanensis TaxID=88456 RepID=A0A1D3D325_9EIME|nr:putative peroxidoxin 2 [Cyclospora cayetanensis]
MQSARLKPLKMPLYLGDTFPNFDAEAFGAENFNLYDYLGNNWGILFSHPNDFTPVCTTELGEAVKLCQTFKDKSCKLIGFSCNDAESHKRMSKDCSMIDTPPFLVRPMPVSILLQEWAKDIAAFSGFHGDLPFPMICDPKRKLATSLGIMDPREKDKAGMPLTCRCVFFISPQKKVAASILYPATTGRSFKEILRALDSLQLTEEYPVATPVEWTAGEPCCVPPQLSEEEVKKRLPKGVRTKELPSGKTYISTLGVHSSNAWSSVAGFGRASSFAGVTFPSLVVPFGSSAAALYTRARWCSQHTCVIVYFAAVGWKGVCRVSFAPFSKLLLDFNRIPSVQRACRVLVGFTPLQQEQQGGRQQAQHQRKRSISVISVTIGDAEERASPMFAGCCMRPPFSAAKPFAAASDGLPIRFSRPGPPRRKRLPPFSAPHAPMETPLLSCSRQSPAPPLDGELHAERQRLDFVHPDCTEEETGTVQDHQQTGPRQETMRDVLGSLSQQSAETQEEQEEEASAAVCGTSCVGALSAGLASRIRHAQKDLGGEDAYTGEPSAPLPPPNGNDGSAKRRGIACIRKGDGRHGVPREPLVSQLAQPRGVQLLPLHAAGPKQLLTAR